MELQATVGGWRDGGGIEAGLVSLLVCCFFAVEPKEIKTLYKRFRRLDRGGRGTISSDDLMMIPEVAMNPLSSRLVSQLFERDPDDRINFKSFVMGLSVFSERARPEVRKRGESSAGNFCARSSFGHQRRKTRRAFTAFFFFFLCSRFPPL